jgi:hypothetical protein
MLGRTVSTVAGVVVAETLGKPRTSAGPAAPWHASSTSVLVHEAGVVASIRLRGLRQHLFDLQVEVVREEACPSVSTPCTEKPFLWNVILRGTRELEVDNWILTEMIAR